MSGSIIYTPDIGADWPNAWQQVEYGRKGMHGLSLTNYLNNSLPAIASGSWVEVAGSVYKWSADDAISGTPASGQINWIKLVPGGSGDTAYVTPTWTTAAPAWSDAYQGWYDGTSRYVAKCFYDGTNYKEKAILSPFRGLSDKNGNELMAVRYETKTSSEQSLAALTSTTYDFTGFSFTPDAIINGCIASNSTSGALQRKAALFGDQFTQRVVFAGVEPIANGVRCYVRNSDSTLLYYKITLTVAKCL